MKILLNIFVIVGLLFFNAAYSVAQETAAENQSAVIVELAGLEESQGSIYIIVYDSADTWLGEETVLQREVAIAGALVDGVVSTQLYLLPGEYAIFIYHDSNGNGDLDTNFIGIPKEPVALSNNARGKFGPPKYKDAVFTLGDEAVTQRLSMGKM